MKNKRKIPVFFIISSAFFLISSALVLVARASSEAADFLTNTVGAAYRRALAYLSDFIPFSLFEVVVALLPLAVGLVIFLAVRAHKKGEGRLGLVLSFLGVVFIILSAYNVSMGTAYHTTPLSERLDISEREINAESLTLTMQTLRDEVNRIAPQIEYSDGVSERDTSLDNLSLRICRAYSDFSDKYGFPESFDSRAKGMVASPVMSLLGLTGIYTFYTGESNVNLTYPTFDVAFTTAHELSHQRGILRENEANFAAFLVLYESSDDYLRYAAALTMLEYVGYALYRTDETGYREIMATLDERALSDLRASSEVSKKYGGTILADISDFFNDLFLKSNGTEGIVSYGMVVTLAVSYITAE